MVGTRRAGGPWSQDAFPLSISNEEEASVVTASTSGAHQEPGPLGVCSVELFHPERPAASSPQRMQTAGYASPSPVPHARLPSRPFPRLRPFSLLGGSRLLPPTPPWLAGLLLGERD